MFIQFSRAFFWALLLLLPATLCGAKEAPQATIKDFRYVYTLEGNTNTGLKRVRLPAAIYEHAQQPGLNDLRVFDSQGQAMPLYISDVPEVINAEERTYPALYARIAEQRGEITLLGGRPSASPPPNTSSSEARPDRREATAVIFDLGEEQFTLTDLRLIPKDPAPSTADTPEAQAQPQIQTHIQTGSVQSVRLFKSKDMVSWRDQGLRTFGRILAEGQQVELLALDLATPARYVLLLPVEGSSLFPVQGLSGKIETRNSNTDTLRVTTGQWDDEAKGYAYTVPPSLPVHSLSLALPGNTWITNAQILTRGPSPRSGRKPRAQQVEKMTWLLRATGMFYALELGGIQQTSDPLPFSPTWLRVAATPNLLLRPTGTVWQQAPDLLLSYEQQDVYFLATGPGPFRLAVGTSMSLPATVDSAVKQVLKQKGANLLLLGEMREQSVASADKATGQKFFIWGALVLGALCMGGIALHILRTQKNTQES